MVEGEGASGEPSAEQTQQRLKSLCVYVAGGLGGLILFGEIARDAFSEVTAYVRASFVTLVIIGGVLLGSAWTSADWPVGEVKGKRRNVPGLRAYRAATIAVLLAGLSLLVAVWWAAISPREGH